MPKKEDLFKSELFADIPDIILKNLLRHNLIDTNFDYTRFVEQTIDSKEFKEFYTSKMEQNYEMEDEIVEKEYNIFENLPKHVPKKVGKKVKKKKSKKKKNATN